MEQAKFRKRIGIAFLVIGAATVYFVYFAGAWLPAHELVRLVALALIAIGLLVLSLGNWARIRAVIFTGDGLFLSFPTTLMCLSLIVGFDPGEVGNNAYLMIWVVLFVLVLPWSIVAIFLGWTGVAGYNPPHEWWPIAFFFLGCLIAVVGAHVNGSLIGWLYRSNKKIKDEK